MANEKISLKITRKIIKKVIDSPEKTAEAVDLVYVTDCEPGIVRVKENDIFEYYFEDEKITDEEELLRIKNLVIPPAWENVWICRLPEGHLQVTGTDAMNRKQYKYHKLWNAVRNRTKFFRLYDFGLALPYIRKRLKKDLSLPGLPLKKVLATVVSLMERTNMRIGNYNYERIYGSYGITTLKDRHVNISGNKIMFTFKGKKGKVHNISLRSKKLSAIVKKCKDIPGKELFQYYDETGSRKSIDSGMVNEYIRQISRGDFTAKDFRTWAGTVEALAAFKELHNEGIPVLKKNIVAVLDTVSALLGNTRAVCKKYYVHPELITLYETEKLCKYLDALDELGNESQSTGLLIEEKVLLEILK